MPSYRFLFSVSYSGSRASSKIISKVTPLGSDDDAKQVFMRAIETAKIKKEQGVDRIEEPYQVLRIDQPEVVTVLETRS